MNKLKTKLKSTPYRFLSTSSDKLTVRFDKDHLKEVTSKQGGLHQLEVIKKGKLGYALSNHLDEEDLIAKSLKSAEFGDRVNYLYPDVKTAEKTNLFSQKVVDLQAEEMIAWGQETINKVKKVDKEILTTVVFSKSISTSYLETAAGLSAIEKGSALTVYTEGERVEEGDILQIGQEFAWREQVFNVDGFAKKLAEKFRLAKKVVPSSGGNMTVVFTPQALETLLSFLERALSAESVYKKVSKWKDSLGLPVADQRFNLIDDPTVDFALGSTLYDDEGFVGKPLKLIENGILKNYYTDLKNASKLHLEPNGRGFGVPASPSLTNILVLGGEKVSQEIIKGINQGILVDQIIGGGQDNPYAGDFSLSIHLGFLIDHGEVVGRVKNMLISGNIFEMIKNKIDKISSDLEWVEGSNKLPYISFFETNVVG